MSFNAVSMVDVESKLGTWVVSMDHVECGIRVTGEWAVTFFKDAEEPDIEALTVISLGILLTDEASGRRRWLGPRDIRATIYNGCAAFKPIDPTLNDISDDIDVLTVIQDVVPCIVVPEVERMAGVRAELKEQSRWRIKVYSPMDYILRGYDQLKEKNDGLS